MRYIDSVQAWVIKVEGWAYESNVKGWLIENDIDYEYTQKNELILFSLEDLTAFKLMWA